ncbi:membrane protein [Bacteroidia bacterium]|nr:membrane protein [Bacteroidia bacterium]
MNALLISCDDFFDRRPSSYIDDEAVWNDPQKMNAVVVDLYARITYEDFDYSEGFWVYSQLNLSSASDESYPSWQQGEFGVGGKTQVIFGDSWFYLWPYDQIRNCNNLLQKLQKAGIAEEEKERISAEVRFIRAFHYFLLVKRFGGVPLVLEVQEYASGQSDKLEVPRDKEQAVYDFILLEMEAIVSILPAKRSENDRNRVSRYAAFALQSRVALYAAAIAQYGKVELNGLTGIAGDSKQYWQIASVAADSVISSNQYALYQQYTDKAENYNRLFLDKNNDEYIWAKEYHLPESGHSFDFRTTPYSFTGGYGCGMTPTREMVEAYEYIDEPDGKLHVADENGLIEYADPMDLFAGKDPRLFASVYLPMSNFKEGKVEIRRGIYFSLQDSFLVAGNLTNKTFLADGTLITVSGKDGIILNQDPAKTGFYQKKFYDEQRLDFSEGKSDQSWPVFRLAEMYLNKAEAEMELGHKAKAVEALNRVRERAGIQTLSENEITLERIRNERRIELAFEGHRFWDLRRWRTADKVLNPLIPTALWPFIVYENGGYVFQEVSGSGAIQKPNKVFLQRHYYLKFKPEEMNSNRKIIQNPGY